MGWPTAMHFARQGYQVAIADNMSKRVWEAELGTAPLWSIPLVHKRVRLWKDKAGHEIKLYIGDIAQNHRFVYKMFEEFRPDAVVHYAEQPSAPYSMHSREKAVNTQVNNVAGNLNVLFAMRKYTPDAKPGSFYHLSKVHDSHNIEFACRIWGLRATDLNQGVVYGLETEETKMHPELLTSFHYDDVFGTALNRFCVQAVAGVPLTVYGQGGQKRGFLNIRDTLQCVQIAVDNPAKSGEFRVFNQFTEVFSVLDLAKTVQQASEALGIKVSINNIPNPRVEAEQHYYNPKNDSLLKLGLKPRNLSNELINSMLVNIQKSKDQIEHHTILPKITWKQ
ncbi:MAG: UDP-sulfoquinovose synthase [Parcubacteria group bacterium Gr01-1014_19]|nr:MAG: UDP-sulfoquinovose synthase [Parcubacteria group bacterium Gr01-1014_19]